MSKLDLRVQPTISGEMYVDSFSRQTLENRTTRSGGRGKKHPRRRGKVGWKQCGQEIGGRLRQLGLLLVFVFNISIHVGRDTIAVLLSGRVPQRVSLPWCSSLGRAVSQIVPPLCGVHHFERERERERERCSKWYHRKLRTAPPRKTDPRPLSIVEISLQTWAREASSAGGGESQVARGSRGRTLPFYNSNALAASPTIRTNVTVTRGWHSECSVDWLTGHRYLLIPSDGQCISLLHCGIYYLRSGSSCSGCLGL